MFLATNAVLTFLQRFVSAIGNHNQDSGQAHAPFRDKMNVFCFSGAKIFPSQLQQLIPNFSVLYEVLHLEVKFRN